MDDTTQPVSAPVTPQENPQTEPVVPVVEQTPPPVVIVNEEKKGHGLKTLLLILLAVVLLAGGGAGIYFGLLNPMTPEPTPTPVPAQVAAPKPELVLSLTNPTVDTVASGKMLTVSGTTLPNTPVAIMTEDHDNALISDNDGRFEGEIELVNGINILVVTAMAEDGQEKSITQEVIYDDQVLGINSENGNANANSNKKVVKNDADTIKKLYKVDNNTKYADEKNKPVGAATVKANDKVVVIVENGLAAKIFVRNASESAQLRMTHRRAVQGVVINMDDSMIYLAHQVQRERQYNVVYNEQTIVKIPGVEISVIADIKTGQRVVAVGNVTETNDLIASKILVIPGVATGLSDIQPVTPYPTLTPTPIPESTPSATLTPTDAPTE